MRAISFQVNFWNLSTIVICQLLSSTTDIEPSSKGLASPIKSSTPSMINRASAVNQAFGCIGVAFQLLSSFSIPNTPCATAPKKPATLHNCL